MPWHYLCYHEILLDRLLSDNGPIEVKMEQPSQRRPVTDLLVNAIRMTATAILLATRVVPLFAQGQSKHSNDIFTVVSRSGHSRVNMHVEGRGDHCWATVSDDKRAAITMGDNLCTLRDEGADTRASLQARIELDKISFRLNGKSYFITDAPTVKSVRSIFDPLVSIADQQSTLSEKRTQQRRNANIQQSTVTDQELKLRDDSRRSAQIVASKVRAMLIQSVENRTANLE